jgi:hypothetical protein
MDNKMDTKTVTLTFTIAELNLVLASLGKQPFEAVSTLVNSIVADAQAQLDKQAQESPTDTE